MLCSSRLWSSVLLVLLLGLPACTSTAQAPTGNHPTTSAIPTEPGHYSLTLAHDHLARGYLLHIPETYTHGEPAPLVVALHGSGMTKETFSQKRKPGLFEAASTYGMLLVFPDGTPCETKAGLCWTSRNFPGLDRADDVGFILTLLDALRGALSIDAQRIYATGFSNGAVMAQRLGAERPGTFAAVAAVAGGIGATLEPGGDLVKIPTPMASIPVMIVRGGRDTSVPYHGGARSPDGRVVTSAQEDADFWVKANGCDPTPEIKQEGDAVQRAWYTQCTGQAEVILFSVAKMPHRWPDGDAGYDFDGNQKVLAFFNRHPR